MNDDKKKRRRERMQKKERRGRKLYHAAGIAAAAVLTILIIIAAWKHYQSSQAAQFQSRLHAVQNGAADSFTQISDDMPLYVLVIGKDGHTPEQANFIGLAAVNKEKKRIHFLMFPDNTRIEGRKENKVQQLQDIYSDGGRELVQAVMEDMLHIPIPFYVEFSEEAFVQLIDMNGGLAMYVEENMHHVDENGAADIDLLQGYQTLDGIEALGYMRYIDGEKYVSRTQRQARLVKHFYTERQKEYGFMNMIFLYRFWNYVDSNISAKDIAWLAFDFRNAGSGALQFYILPGEITEDGQEGNRIMWTYDPIEGQKIIGATNNSIAEAPAKDDAD